MYLSWYHACVVRDAYKYVIANKSKKKYNRRDAVRPRRLTRDRMHRQYFGGSGKHAYNLRLSVDKISYAKPRPAEPVWTCSCGGTLSIFPLCTVPLTLVSLIYIDTHSEERVVYVPPLYIRVIHASEEVPREICVYFGLCTIFRKFSNINNTMPFISVWQNERMV